MPQLITDFNQFMQMPFRSLAMGLTPSGHIHLGFLVTLACALMYLREHPKAHLALTNIENSLASRREKYHGVPLRFQTIVDGELVLPRDYEHLRKRNFVCQRVSGEINDLIWKLVSIFDKRTLNEKRAIKEAFIPPKHKKWLQEKEHRIFHIFGTQIYVYSFLRVLQRDRRFRTRLMKYLTDYEFAKIVSPMANLFPRIRNFGNVIQRRGKKYSPKCFQIPVRLYCPDCHILCSDWAVVVVGHPKFKGPVLAARCNNTEHCSRGQKQEVYERYVYHNVRDSLDMAEFHFMLDPIRDFIQPFQADCHIFGGDYFQLRSPQSGLRGIDRIYPMFDFLEKATGQKKYVFGGPLITMEGKKMSKSGEAFNLKDMKNIRKVFLNIIKILEGIRKKSFPKELQLEYTDIIEKAA